MNKQERDYQLILRTIESIRDYERESHNLIGHDERETEEFVDIFIESEAYKSIPVSDQPDPKLEGWISVEDRLPVISSKNKSFKKVLSLTNLGCIDITTYDHRKGWHEYYLKKDEIVTHWQPLPTPPKKG